MLTQDSLVGVSMDVGRTLTHDWSTSRRLDLLLSVSDSDTRRHSALFVSSPGSVGESAIPAAAGDGMEPRPLPSDSSPRRNDSFVGSETLSEIRKLLGKAGGILDSGQGEAAVLGGEDGGELVCRQDRPEPAEATEVGAVLLQPPSSRDPGAALRPKSPARMAARGRWRHAGRDEPEGCRGAASGGGVSGSDPAQGHPASSQSSGGQAVLPQLPGPTRRAWVHASDSDSGDTIEASSHTDSLGAWNSSPLPAQGPTEVVKRLSTTDLDKEPSTQGWEGTKQSMRPLGPLSMLSEEDRKRIEEIKAELLQQSKTSVSSQAVWLEEAEDLSPASDSSQSARSFTTFRSLDTARSQIFSQLQGASDTTVEPRTPLRGNMERLPEAVGVPRTDCPPPIAAITFSSRRKPLSASPLPTAALLTPPPTGHGEPLGRTHPPAAEVPSEPRHGEQLAGKMALSPAKAAPLRPAARTVLSLSPNRPDTPTVRSADHPSSSGKPPFPASDGQGTAKAPRPSLPPQDPVLGSASPLYPPWPMPMPALWSTFPPSFDRSSEAGLPSTGEPPSQARIFAAQDANKVDVSTQTSGRAPSSPAAPTPSEAQRQDGQSRIERTPSIPAPMTGGTTAVSSCASTTDGPLMLPYKPAGSSRLFYVANAGLRQRSALVVSENGSELSRPGAVPHRSLLSAGTVSFERLPTRDPRGGGPDPSSVQGHWRNQQQRQREDGRRQTPASVTVRQAWPDLRGQRDEDWPDPHERGKQDWPDPHMQAAENWTDPRERGEEDWSDPHERKEEDWSDPHEREEENWPDPCEQMAEPGLTYKELAKAAARSAHAEGSPGNGVPGPGDPQWWVGTEDPRWGADPRLPLRRGVERGPLLRSGADLRLPRQSVADPGPPRWSGVDHRPLRRSAVDPGPPWWGGAEPGPPRQGADPGPPRQGGADPGPLRRGRAELGPPRRSAADLGPPRRSAADLGPPRRSAADPGPPRRSGADRGPPRQVVDLGPPRRGGAGPGPPRRGGAGLGPPRWGGPLDQLWERLKERQQQQQSLGSSTDSELSLLERLHQLAQFLRAPLQTPTPSSSASPADDSTDRILEHRLCALPGTSESDTASTPSTIDTARLIRAFGPERVLPLARLYSTIQQQKESSAHRRERRRRGETRHPATRTAQQADSVSPTTSNSAAAGRRCTRPPRGRSSRLVARKGARLVDQGVQAGSLEIVPGTTRRQTRDVGVTFPSPDSDLAPHRWAGRWEPSASLSPAPSTQQPADGGRERRGKVRCLTDSRQGEGTRKPAVAWFVPAHELQGDGRKENVPVPRRRPVEAWGLREAGPPWRREPLRQIHLQGSWNPAAGGKSPSALVPLTLREALGVNRPWFISRSRERQRRLALRTHERRFQNLLQSERERLFNPPSAPGSRSRRGQRTDCSILYKKMISKQEMLDRSRRLYEQLPEVTRRRDEENRRTESRTNRLRAQLYKQKITNRILGKKVSWQ